MIIEERVERSQYVKLITWIVSFIILMAGIVSVSYTHLTLPTNSRV